MTPEGTDAVLGAWHDHEAIAEAAIRLQADRQVAGAWVDYLELRARSIIQGQWDHIERIALALLDRRRLSAREVRDVYIEPIQSPNE